MNSRRKFINVNFTMSYEEYQDGFTMPEFHYHNDYEIYILEHGNRIVNVQGEELETVAGDVTFFTREIPHKSKGNESFSGICIHFSERYLKRYFTESAIEKMMHLFPMKKLHLNETEVANIKKITEEFVIDDEYNFLRLAHIFEILSNNLDGNINFDLQKNHSAEKIHNAGKSSAILAYVNENYTYIKEIKELAALFEISESYLFQIFKKEYGCTPKTYINRLKIKNICNRMKHSDATIKSIATDYGFESYEHFCRVFKKELGCTPTKYRKERL